jgi:hypothetical protein
VMLKSGEMYACKAADHGFKTSWIIQIVHVSHLGSYVKGRE